MAPLVFIISVSYGLIMKVIEGHIILSS